MIIMVRASNCHPSSIPSYTLEIFLEVAVVVVVGFYGALLHLGSSASLSAFSVKSPTNFAQRDLISA